MRRSVILAVFLGLAGCDARAEPDRSAECAEVCAGYYENYVRLVGDYCPEVGACVCASPDHPSADYPCVGDDPIWICGMRPLSCGDPDQPCRCSP